MRTETRTAPSVLRQFKNRIPFSLVSRKQQQAKVWHPGGAKPFACCSAGWLVSNLLANRRCCRLPRPSAIPYDLLRPAVYAEQEFLRLPTD